MIDKLIEDINAAISKAMSPDLTGMKIAITESEVVQDNQFGYYPIV